MKRMTALLLSVLLLLTVLVSCGEATTPSGESEIPSNEPGSSFEATDSTDSSEPETEPQTEPEPETKYPTEYVAPEDGSFTICGIPLSEYSLVLYFPSTSDYTYMERNQLTRPLKETIGKATGTELDLKVVKNEKYDTEKWAEHEILFGSNFNREGMPESDLKKNYYGVTEDGTVYFSSPSPLLYRHLWKLFLEEFFGVPYDSGEASLGCAIEPCYRELPVLNDALLEKMGYTVVLDETFDGDELNPEIWEFRKEPGKRRAGYNHPDQVSVKDGCLILTAEYKEDGAFGPAWYTGWVHLKQQYCRGYFEATIRCSERIGRSPADFWSAFWIQGPAPYTPEQSQAGVGPGGCEIDVMECWGTDHQSCCLWVSGEEGKGNDLTSEVHEIIGMGNDYSQEFHTYSIIWDEAYYQIYIDGILVCYTNVICGTSSVEQEVILSLEDPSDIPLEPGTVRQMMVDSLRIWQKQ
ncbi:MAG: family 16 glycosylhydrolase [Clostridia bacterium]|nr:family 16 glycosylhydrolase [Clostridia bacterium]